MKKFYLIINLILLFGCSQPREFKIPPYQTLNLGNNLEIFIFENHELPLVSFSLYLKAGPIFDPADKRGLAYLTNKLLLKGTEKLSASQLAEEIDFIGGELEANVFDEFSLIEAASLKKDYLKCRELFASVILEPKFSKAEIDRLKKETLAKIIQMKNNPEDIAYLHFKNLIYKPHPYAHPSWGYQKTLKNIKRDDILTFYHKHFLANQAILVIVGDIEAQEILSWAKEKFGRWKQGETAFPQFPPPPSIKGINIRLINKDDATQTQIRIGSPGIKRNSPDFHATEILAQALGGASNSILFEKIRIQKGLTYGISSDFLTKKESGSFLISTFSQNKTTTEAIRETLQEIKKVKNEGLEKKRFNEAKKFLKGSFSLEMETIEDIAKSIIAIKLYNLDKNFLRDYLKNLTAVTLQDVKRVAGKYIPDNNLIIVTVGKAEEIKDSLRTIGEIEIKSLEEELD